MKLIQCDRSQYLKRLDTEKAYAIQYSKYGERDVIFLSKKYVKMEAEPCEEDPTTIYYWFELPDWLYDKIKEKHNVSISLFEEEATQRVVDHDARTKSKRWYDNRETCQHLKPF